MRTLKKEDAIREFGSHYSHSLEGFDIDLHERGPRTPEEQLIEKLEAFSGARMDSTVKFVEGLGQASEIFHYKDIDDVKRRVETEKRAEYKKAMREFSVALQTAESHGLLEHIDHEDIEPERKPLQEAFLKAFEKMYHLDAFLSSRQPFTVEVEPMKDTVTVPDVIAKTGDTVYVVKDDGKETPVISETTITKSGFHKSFFRGPDYTVSYETGLDAGKKDWDTKGLHSIDAGEGREVPEGAFARGLHSVAFNSKAAAEKHAAALLDKREADLEAQLKDLRARRKGLTP